MAEGPEIEIARIPLDLIDDEPGNPNEMDPESYAALRVNIEEFGYVQPLLVRADGERFRLIDGHHRKKILAELGYRVAPAVVAEADAAEGKLQLLATNRNRGTDVPIKFALMLADVARTIPEDQIRRKLAMKEPELRDTLQLMHRQEEGTRARMRAQLARVSDRALRFVVSPSDEEAIERALRLVVSDDLDRGQALGVVCRTYEQSQQQAKASK